MQLTTRNATLADLAELLQEQQARKLDVVAQATQVRAVNGRIVLAGTEAEMTEEGVTATDGTFGPTAVCDEGLADKLRIPVAYLKRLREARPDLYDANVNGWLHGAWGAPTSEYGDVARTVEPDARKFMVRTFRGDAGDQGIARAFLSDTYRIVDNFDVLTATLEGVRDAGVEVNVVGCDLTERRMHVRVACPQVTALAPALLEGYRSPFDAGVARAGESTVNLGGGGGQELPVVFAGFHVSNSEVGGGAFQIVPRIVVRVCSNGMTVTRDAMRAVHLGGRLEEGVIRWSADTQRRSLDLVTAQARDAVATFLDSDYLDMVVGKIEEQAGHRLDAPAEAVEVIGRQLKFSEERTKGILDHFICGGQATAGGVLNAVTSYAQVIPDADEAAEVEGHGLRVLELAASL